jgi:hypothetical protein
MSAHDGVVDASATGVGVSTNAMDFRALVTQAQTNADFDSKLTVMEALKKHKKAVFWAMILSTSLVMEGYDLVIVSFPCHHLTTLHQLTPSPRSTRSMVSRNSSEDSGGKSHLGSGPSQPTGSLACPTRLLLAN